MVLDPRHAAPSTYACCAPLHFLLTRRVLAPLLARLVPARRPMDNMPAGWDHPQEDEFALCNLGIPSPYLTIVFPNEPAMHAEYISLERIPPEDRDRWKRTLDWFLRALTVAHDRRLVLKSPLHTCRIKLLLEMFPDARFVHIVRDPLAVFASTMHLWKRLCRDQGLQSPRFDDLEERILSAYERMYESFERDLPLLAPARFCEVRYEDLVADMPGQMRRIYEALELGGFEQALPAIRDYAKKHADYRPNRYTISEQAREQVARRWGVRGAVKTLGLALLALHLNAQNFEHRGFLDLRFTAYPQTAAMDSGRAVAEALLRYEPSYKITPDLRLEASVDARTDSHRQVEREWGLSWQDREIQRPALAVRRLSAIYHRGGVTAELGKQFIRWGKTDLLNPTDRFAPRDFVSVVDTGFLAVTAARLTWEASRTETIDLVCAPRFTPSRIPPLKQRWVVLPPLLQRAPLEDTGARLPGGSQFGVRWSHTGSRFEHSLSFYEGFNHFPTMDGWIAPAPFRIALERFYPQMRMYGGDAAIPLRWFTLKGEAAYLTSRSSWADEYLQYVVQLERQTGEWHLVAGYTGESVTLLRGGPGFAPDRGLARTFLGRAQYNIDVNRSLAFESAAKRNGDGFWLKVEYSQAVSSHLRATVSFNVIRGALEDFLGQYRRNSFGTVSLRYSL
jgi:hypothetical protein